MEFKVGDLVRVRKDLEVGKDYGGLTLLEGMENGLETFPTSGVIESVDRDCLGIVAYQIEGNVFGYTAEMLEKVEEKKADSEKKTITITREDFRAKIGKVLHDTLSEMFNSLTSDEFVLLTRYYFTAVLNAEKAFFGKWGEGEEQ